MKKTMTGEKKYTIETLVKENRKWLEHSVDKDAPLTQRMFMGESYYDSFWAHAEHGVIVIDEDLKIIEANPAFCSLLDVTPEEVRGTSIRKLIPAYGNFTDFVNIEAIIKGKNYSFKTDSNVNEKFNKSADIIPVRIVATRVPSHLHEDFKHIIMCIYPLDWTGLTRTTEQDMLKKMTVGEFIKVILGQHFWGVAFILVSLFILTALSGDLGNVVINLIKEIF